VGEKTLCISISPHTGLMKHEFSMLFRHLDSFPILKRNSSEKETKWPKEIRTNKRKNNK
jgi:hypothetical protein